VQGGRRWAALARVGWGSSNTVRIQPGMGTREGLSARGEGGVRIQPWMGTREGLSARGEGGGG
jgi:hypothetical protein